MIVFNLKRNAAFFHCKQKRDSKSFQTRKAHSNLRDHENLDGYKLLYGNYIV